MTPYSGNFKYHKAGESQAIICGCKMYVGGRKRNLQVEVTQLHHALCQQASTAPSSCTRTLSLRESCASLGATTDVVPGVFWASKCQPSHIEFSWNSWSGLLLSAHAQSWDLIWGLLTRAHCRGSRPRCPPVGRVTAGVSGWQQLEGRKSHLLLTCPGAGLRGSGVDSASSHLLYGNGQIITRRAL